MTTELDSRLDEYAASVHAACDAATRAARQRAADHQTRERTRIAAIASRTMSRTMSARSLSRAWDRLRSRGLIPAPRPVSGARALPDTTLPAWCEGLRDDELGLAWIASVEFSTAPRTQWSARARSLARDERIGRYAGETSREQIIERTGKSSYVGADSESLADYESRLRDDDDERAVQVDRLNWLRRELGPRLANYLASGMTQQQAADLCDVSLITVARALARVKSIARQS